MHLDPARADLLSAAALRLAPVTAHDQTVFWVQMALLLIFAVSLGRVAARLGQPPVVGQLLAGVILGPTVFGELWPTGFNWFLPRGELVQSSLLFAVSTLSLAMLLLTVGFETDLTLLRRLGRSAGWVTVGSLLLPLGAGVAVALALPVSVRGPLANALSFSLLVGVALGASSLPVIAEIVTHLGATRRDFGQITLAAGTVNDALAFVLIAFAVAMGASGAVSQLAKVVIGLLVLGTLVTVFAQPLVDRLLRAARRHGPERGTPNSHPSLAICLVAAMVAAALVQLIGVEGALGAFVAGVVLARSRFGDAETFRFVTQLSSSFFAPIYFATAGLEANLALLRHPEVLIVCLVFIVVGSVAKFAGSYLGAAAGRLPQMERIALGIGLNGRGTVQVIAGTVGLASGILNTGTYTAIVAMSLVTSIATPPLLRRAVRRWSGSAEERRRLDLEARLARQALVTDERVLLVADQARAGADAIRLVELAWPKSAELTVITTDAARALRDSPPAASAARAVEWRDADNSDVAQTITSELKLGYGALVLASQMDGTGDTHEPSLVEQLVPVVNVPTLLVLRPGTERPSNSIPPGIMVSVSGARASRAALEVAFSLAEQTHEVVQLLHVDTSPRGLRSLRPDRLISRRILHHQRDQRAAEAILAQAVAMSSGYDVTVRPEVLANPEFEPGLVAAAAGNGLVLVGVRPVATDQGIYFGEAAEAVLHHLPDRAVLVTLPD